jgi:hypothetical protein
MCDGIIEEKIFGGGPGFYMFAEKNPAKLRT